MTVAVQPQLGRTWVMLRMALPVLVTWYFAATLRSGVIRPKSWWVLSKLMTGAWAVSVTAAQAKKEATEHAGPRRKTCDSSRR